MARWIDAVRWGGRSRSSAVSAVVISLAVVACAGLTPTVDLPAPAPSGPPSAIASVDGGDPVAAQLGTYTWGTTGSDSPWLRGAPIAVGPGEAMSIVFDPPIAAGSWTARYVPHARGGPDGAVALGEGGAPVGFPVPPPGIWTVELSVIFVDGQGSASYAWSVTVE